MKDWMLSGGWIWTRDGFVRADLHGKGEYIVAVLSEKEGQPPSLPGTRSFSEEQMSVWSVNDRFLTPGFWDLSWKDESLLFTSHSSRQDLLSHGVTTIQVLVPADGEMISSLLQQDIQPMDPQSHHSPLHTILHPVANSLAEWVDFLQTGLRSGIGNGAYSIGGLFLQVDNEQGDPLWPKGELKRCAYVAQSNHWQVLLSCNQTRNLPQAIEAFIHCKDCPIPTSFPHRLVAPPVLNESLLHISLHLPLAIDVQGHLLHRLWQPLKNKKPGGSYARLRDWVFSPYFHLISGGDYPVGLGQWKAAEEQLLSLLQQENRDCGESPPLEQLQQMVRSACLKAATERPARHSPAGRRFKGLQEEMFANLLVLQQNPLRERRLGLYPHLERVMLWGAWIDFC